MTRAIWGLPFHDYGVCAITRSPETPSKSPSVRNLGRARCGVLQLMRAFSFRFRRLSSSSTAEATEETSHERTIPFQELAGDQGIARDDLSRIYPAGGAGNLAGARRYDRKGA